MIYARKENVGEPAWVGGCWAAKLKAERLSTNNTKWRGNKEKNPNKALKWNLEADPKGVRSRVFPLLVKYSVLEHRMSLYRKKTKIVKPISEKENGSSSASYEEMNQICQQMGRWSSISLLKILTGPAEILRNGKKIKGNYLSKGSLFRS